MSGGPLKSKPTSLLRLPSGSATLFLQEARHQQILVQELNQLYDRWAYLPVHTPLVDFSHSYEGLIPEKDLKRVYHLVDRDGEILMLRWDLTLFLIKQVRSLLLESPLPLRLCYADSILRHQDSDDISHNEFFQTGAELIGSAGPDGDLEVLLLLHQALQSLSLPAAVHLGSRKLYNLAFGELEDSLSADLSHAIAYRDFGQARHLAAQLPDFTKAKSEALIALFTIIANPAEASLAVAGLASHLSPSLIAEARSVISFAESAQSMESDLDIHVDFSELGSQSYHSGIVFQAYVEGMSAPVASGGRYDLLLERLGSPAPAVGFSIMLSKIARSARLKDQADPEIVKLASDDTSFAERYQQATSLRAAGKRVAL